MVDLFLKYVEIFKFYVYISIFDTTQNLSNSSFKTFKSTLFVFKMTYKCLLSIKFSVFLIFKFLSYPNILILIFAVNYFRLNVLSTYIDNGKRIMPKFILAPMPIYYNTIHILTS